MCACRLRERPGDSSGRQLQPHHAITQPALANAYLKRADAMAWRESESIAVSTVHKHGSTVPSQSLAFDPARCRIVRRRRRPPKPNHTSDSNPDPEATRSNGKVARTIGAPARAACCRPWRRETPSRSRQCCRRCCRQGGERRAERSCTGSPLRQGSVSRPHPQRPEQHRSRSTGTGTGSRVGVSHLPAAST